jgi:DNA topoisomerase-1
MSPGNVDLEKALALLSLPKEVARHPESGEPILAGIGRYGPYVQHGKTYANIDKDDDILQIGANRAIDLIVAKESGGGGSRFGRGAAVPGRELGEHPAGGKLVVRAGKYGPYVNWGKVNATLPKALTQEAITLEQAVELVNAKAESSGVKGPGKAKAAKAPAKKPSAKSAAKPAAAKAGAKTAAKPKAGAAKAKAAAKG